VKLRLSLFCLAVPAFGAYTYYYSDPLTSINPSNWSQNGSVSGGSTGLTASSSNGGSLISKVAVPGTYPANYEVKVSLNLTASGGTYVTYLRATPNAQSGPASTGTSYAVELQNPAFSNGVCSGATLAAYQIINNQSTILAAGGVPCHNGMVLRTVLTANGILVTYIDDFQYLYLPVSGIASGQPGIGARSTPAGNGISLVALGPLDTIAPGTINVQSVMSSSFPNHVDLQWGGVVDDTSGSGLAGYAVYRDGTYIGSSHDAAFTDATVAPNVAYTYQIGAADYHYNWSTISFTVVTPPPAAVDPREIGVRPLGSYWGDAGERIDMRSGNLNFTVPLLRAVGRGGWGVQFQLSYNSQQWRYDSAGVWAFERDSGYGCAWTLQAGSLLPVWSSYWTIHHYMFTDGSGARYRLDQNNNNIWTSKEGVYVSYDANTGRLYFPDGSFWVFGSVSAGMEWDAGTQYPTLMEDSNGNQILLSYQAGVNTGWVNSSGRISRIQDTRAGSSAYTYLFNYADGYHLSSITNTIGSAESYTFQMAPMETYSPFALAPGDFGAPGYLNSITQTGAGGATSFVYSANGGELTQVTLPQGGSIQWAYASYALNGAGAVYGRTLREVQYRNLIMSPGGTQYSYQITRDPGDGSRTVHLYGGLIDFTAGAAKVWWLQTDTTQINVGLVTELDERTYPVQSNVRIQNFAYSQDPAGNPYVSSVTTTMDPGQSYALQKKTTQTIDAWGNVTSMQIYDWGNLSTPARAYTNTYLTDPNYTSRYIHNRLLTSVLTNVTPNLTLISNIYDGSGIYAPNGSPGEWDAQNYGTAFSYRGNVTQTNSPGRTINTIYDATGTVVSQNDSLGHSVNVTTSSATNFTLPEQLDLNGAGQLLTTATYAPNFAPASVAGPGQVVYDPNTSPNGTAAYTHYDSYGRVDYTLAASQVAGQAAGARTDYTYSYATPWSITATTQGGSGSRWTRTVLDGLGRTASVQAGYGSTTVSLMDTEYAPCACSPLGKMSRQSQPYAPGDTKVYTTYTYDALGRTITPELFTYLRSGGDWCRCL
jgi:hypothetical protein